MSQQSSLLSAIFSPLNFIATIGLLSFTAWSVSQSIRLFRGQKFWSDNWSQFSEKMKALVTSEDLKIDDYSQLFLLLRDSPWKFQFPPIINRLTALNISGFSLIESFYIQFSKVIAENIPERDSVPPRELLKIIAAIALSTGIFISILQLFLSSPPTPPPPQLAWGLLCGLLSSTQVFLLSALQSRYSHLRERLAKREAGELILLIQKRAESGSFPSPPLKSQYTLITERTEKLEGKIEELQRTFLIYGEVFSQLLKEENFSKFVSNFAILAKKLKELLESLEQTAEKLERALAPIELSERVISERLEQMTRYFETLTETVEELSKREEKLPQQLRTLIREILIPTHENLHQISNTFLNAFENFVQTSAQERQLLRAELQSFSTHFTSFSQALHHLQLCQRELAQIIELLSGLSDRTALVRTAATSPLRNTSQNSEGSNGNSRRSGGEMSLTQEIEREIDTILRRFEQEGDNNPDSSEKKERDESSGDEEGEG